MKRKPRPKRTYRPLAPRRSDSPLAGDCEPSRRRFLRQLAAGTGALCLVGLPRTSRSQEMSVKFYRLDGHPTTEVIDIEAESTPPAEAETPEEIAEVIDVPPGEGEPTPTEAAVDSIEEDRALWVEPGYLVLVRWRRPRRDNSPVAALESAGPLLEDFLRRSVTSVDQLHNLDRLHRIETELMDVLQRRVAPATIDVLHLDHDCTIVCSEIEPSRHFPEAIDVDGRMVAPDWE